MKYSNVALSVFITLSASTAVANPTCFSDSTTLKNAIDAAISSSTSGAGYNDPTYGPIENWCFTSGVTDFTDLFRDKNTFNANISAWDVSSITRMFTTFRGASAFNQDIGGWDVSSVTNMYAMFLSARAFNQAIGGWDVSSVTNMYGVFYSAVAFNQDIGGWNVSSVNTIDSIFLSASAFNQDISGWDVSSVTDLDNVFRYASAFNQDLCLWGPKIFDGSPPTRSNVFQYSKCPNKANPEDGMPPQNFCSSICELPSDEPSILPSDEPSIVPSTSVIPSDEPSDLPSDEPSVVPSDEPSVVPSDEPSVIPSDEPSDLPSDEPSVVPSDEPSVVASDEPSLIPSDEPSVVPSDEPSVVPSDEPSVVASDEPSVLPSDEPTRIPTRIPTKKPTPAPSQHPSTFPTASPSKSVINSPSVIPTPGSPTEVPVVVSQGNAISELCGACADDASIQDAFNSQGYSGNVEVIYSECTDCVASSATSGVSRELQTGSQGVRFVIQFNQIATDTEEILEPFEVISFFNSKIESITTIISQKTGSDITVQGVVREIEAPSVAPSQSPAPSLSLIPSISFGPTQKYPPSASPTFSQNPTVTPTTKSSRTFQIVSSFNFDDSGRDFCLNAMKIKIGRRAKMRPCRDGFRKQMWFWDDFNQLRLRQHPNFCLVRSQRTITLGKCDDDGSTVKTRFLYDKSRGVVYVKKRKRVLYLGVEPNDKYGPVRMFLERQNETYDKWIFF